MTTINGVDFSQVSKNALSAAKGALNNQKAWDSLKDIIKNLSDSLTKDIQLIAKRKLRGEFNEDDARAYIEDQKTIARIRIRSVAIIGLQLAESIWNAIAEVFRTRGILATVYVKADPKVVHETLAKAYADEPFLQVLPFGAPPSTRDIAGSNYCHIGVIGDRVPGRTVVVAVLDNLTKGSSGQALQNANLMLGIEETTGLMLAPVFP